MIDFKEALEIVFSNLPKRTIKKVNLNDAAYSYLAEQIESPVSLPPFDNSAMDGYAIRSEDTQMAAKDSPIHLNLIAEVPAGTVYDGSIHPREAVAISTGAPIPAGADAVIPVENTERKSDNEVLILRSIRSGANIRYIGEDVNKGDTIIRQGAYLNPARLALLASIGKTALHVYRKPCVGFLATGDELVQPAQTPTDGQIRNSNTIMIKSLCESEGAVFFDYGIASDSSPQIIKKLEYRKWPQIIVTSAGVSVGEHDVVSDSLEHLGMVRRFWKTSIKPGKPLLFGTINESLYFGLPGNPVSAAVMFMQFVTPVIRFLSGAEKPFTAISKAEAVSSIKKTKDRLHLVRGYQYFDHNWKVKTVGKQRSHILSSMADANCFIYIPADRNIEPGDEVAVQSFNANPVSLTDFMQSLSQLLR